MDLSEDEVKRALDQWLVEGGWTAQVRWGHEHGIDIDAHRKEERWIIEAKGSGSLNPMRVNYFISVIGETLQRMDDPKARYSIALPDMPQFRNLWSQLPSEAKLRTGITVFFVDANANVEHLE